MLVQVLSRYLKGMTLIGELLGGTGSNGSVIMKRMQEVIAFEQAIAQVDRILCSPLEAYVYPRKPTLTVNLPHSATGPPLWDR